LYTIRVFKCGNELNIIIVIIIRKAIVTVRKVIGNDDRKRWPATEFLLEGRSICAAKMQFEITW